MLSSWSSFKNSGSFSPSLSQDDEEILALTVKMLTDRPSVPVVVIGIAMIMALAF